MESLGECGDDMSMGEYGYTQESDMSLGEYCLSAGTRMICRLDDMMRRHGRYAGEEVVHGEGRSMHKFTLTSYNT